MILLKKIFWVIKIMGNAMIVIEDSWNVLNLWILEILVKKLKRCY